MSERILVTVPSGLLREVDDIVHESDYKRSDIVISGLRLFVEEYNRKKHNKELGDRIVTLLEQSDNLNKSELVELITLVKKLVK